MVNINVAEFTSASCCLKHNERSLAGLTKPYETPPTLNFLKSMTLHVRVPVLSLKMWDTCRQAGRQAGRGRHGSRTRRGAN